jgi:hypothetical protein
VHTAFIHYRKYVSDSWMANDIQCDKLDGLPPQQSWTQIAAELRVRIRIVSPARTEKYCEPLTWSHPRASKSTDEPSVPEYSCVPMHPQWRMARFCRGAQLLKGVMGDTWELCTRNGAAALLDCNLCTNTQDEVNAYPSYSSIPLLNTMEGLRPVLVHACLLRTCT